MKRGTIGAVLDLMPAGSAVGDDQRGRFGAAYFWQQREFSHLDRGPIGVGAVTERAGHAAATGLDDLDLQAGNEPQDLFDRLERAEGFLVAMAMHHCRLRDRPKGQLEAAGLGLANQKLL